MQQTTNYNFKKLELTDAPPDITELNDNWDGIDATLKELSDNKAPLDSPNFSGTPTAPTPTTGDDSTKLATTAFVKTAVGNVDLSSKMNHTIYVNNPSLNALLADGSYVCGGTMTNLPIPTTYCILRNYDTDTTNKIVQVCYVPVENNYVRTFVRVYGGSGTFGPWLELATTEYVDEQVAILNITISENRFRADVLADATTKSITNLYISTFETADDIDTTQGDGQTFVDSYYDATAHCFNKTDTGSMTVYLDKQTSTQFNSNAWVKAEWESVDSGTLQFAVSRDGGTTFSNITMNKLISISSQPTGTSVVLKFTMTGKLKIKNIAWGLRS